MTVYSVRSNVVLVICRDPVVVGVVHQAFDSQGQSKHLG